MPPMFPSRRAKVFFRDNYTCQAHKVGLPYCGYRPLKGHKGLTAHHLVPGSERIDDQLTMCRPCHDKAEEIKKAEITAIS